MADGRAHPLNGSTSLDGPAGIAGPEADRLPGGSEAGSAPARVGVRPAGGRRAIDRIDIILVLAIFAVAAVVQIGRISSTVDYKLSEQWFRLFPGALTGDLTVIEIDARSLRALQTWPWPRTYHAEAVRKLADAGAIVIGFDVDFSSYSNLENDTELVSAVAASAAPVVLPVFEQIGWVSPGQSGIIEALPIPELLHNAMLAHVNVQPDPDGIVRRHLTSAALETTGVLPSMAVALAGVPPRHAEFVPDFSIPIQDVTRISFVDLLNDSFDASDLAGRHVLIGATAIELGDQLSVPVHVTLPGVLFHALIYETLRQDAALVDAAPEAILAGSLLLAAFLLPLLRRLGWRFALLTAVGGGTAVLGIGVAAQTLFGVIIPVVPWLLVTALAFVTGLLAQIDGLLDQLLQKAMALLHRTAMMRSIVNDTSDGILIADRMGNVSFANPALKTMLGMDEGQIARRHLAREFADLTQLWRDSDTASPSDTSGVQSGSARPAEHEIITPAGAKVVVEIRAAFSRMSPGRGPRGAESVEQTGIFTLRDISARKKLEHAQAVALEEARSASAAKTSFLANMNHELRTPLNSIIGFSEMMREQVFGPLGSDTYRKYANDIHEAGDRLQKTVNDVMEAARIDSGSYLLQEDTADLGAVLVEAVSSLSESAEAQGVTVAVQDPGRGIRIKCDPEAIREVFGRIIDNAIRFNKPAGRVDILCLALRKGGVLIEISDTGIGLSESDIAKVLQPFGQADAALSRKYEGSGLGLTIASGLMRLHGGSIELISRLGVGTTVTVSCPAERVEVDEGVRLEDGGQNYGPPPSTIDTDRR